MYLVSVKIWSVGKKRRMNVGMTKTRADAQKLMVDKAMFMLEARGWVYRTARGEHILLFTRDLNDVIESEKLPSSNLLSTFKKMGMATDSKVVFKIQEDGFVIKIEEVDDYSSYDSEEARDVWKEKFLDKLRARKIKITAMEARVQNL